MGINAHPLDTSARQYFISMLRVKYIGRVIFLNLSRKLNDAQDNYNNQKSQHSCYN